MAVHSKFSMKMEVRYKLKGPYRTVLMGKQTMFNDMIMYSIVSFSIYAAVYLLIVFGS